MATQTLEFNAPSGLTISCKLFAVGSDTVVDTQTATEKTNALNRYSVAFTDAPAQATQLIGFVGAVGGFVNEIYDLTASTATFYPRSETQFASQASVDAISGLVVSPSPTVERVLGDEDAIRFSWPVDGATITGEVSKAGGAYAAVTGAITQRADEGTTHWYQLAYNAADRQLGSVRYKFTDGTDTRYVNLLVNPASAEVDLDPVLNAIGTPAGDDIAADIAAVKSDTATLLERVTTTVATLWANLTAMITGSGETAKYTVTALENAPAGGGGSTTISDEDIQEIVAGVTAVAPRICDSSAGTFRMRAGDTWIQDFTVTTTGADKFIVAVKNDAADDDTAAVLLIDSVDGLERVNGAVPASAGDASIATGAATITATVQSNITLMIIPGKYVVTVKKLDAGSDVTPISTASLTVFAPGVSEIST